MNKLLLEIGTEEMPAGYIAPAAEKLREMAIKEFEEAILPHGKMKIFATPRRLTLIIDDIPEKQDERTKKVSGPPKKAGLDKDGKPTKAAIGFAKKNGLTFEDLQIESTPKGEYFYAEVQEGGGETLDVLKKLLPKMIAQTPFPKTMRWGGGETRFARPIRSIVALLGKSIIDFSINGIQSGNQTFGHRFNSNGPVEISGADGYESALIGAGVLVDPEKREILMLKSFGQLERELGCKVVMDEELLDTVCYLTESPIAVACSFDESYLTLPRELLITVMKHHQRYFSVEDSKGNLSNIFVAFSNTDCTDMSVVKQGYERVLAARFADAKFFYNEDRETKMDEFAKRLSGIVYIKNLGTIADKAERIARIAKKIAESICPNKLSEVEQAAKLCKADLTTSMVYEFPELQGIMGREYAIAEGLNEAVATAIDEHYLPKFSGDELPSTDVARAVALADKIDTIAGCYSIGLIPTGSEDPFSLRRHALGIIRILLSSCDGLSLFQLIRWGVEQFSSGEEKNSELRAEIYSFFAGRIKNRFMEQNFPYDVIDAVLAAGADYLPSTLKRCEAMAEMKSKEYSENIAIGYKRAENLSKNHHSLEVDEEALKEDAEIELLKSLKEREQKIQPLMRDRDYPGVLREIANIRDAVDNFFDSVMVMTDDEETRNNRLSLLKRVTRLFAGLADFSKLVY